MAVQIDLWFWRLDRGDDEVAAHQAWLTPDELARANRFLKPRDKARFVIGRGHLREILGGYVGCAPGALNFQTVAQKKPALADGPAFNLSHSGGWVALAVTPDAPQLHLGIDIEAHRPIEHNLARRFFSAAEQTAIETLPPEDWQLGFFQTWTRKEAVIKATGDGLYADLAGFDVSLGRQINAQVLRTTPPMPDARNWALTDLDTGPAFSGALAAVTDGAMIKVQVREGHLPLPEL
ncbi:MAG: 4'-phosphopantetheinyl transferase [Sulfitobacter sp.]|jgi:4'-phosphopantetheinyl transferase